VETSYRSGARIALIYDQSPEPRRVAHPGDGVSVSVVAPPVPVSVPSVIGMQVDSARATLRSVGLDLGAISPVSRPVASAIVSQRPAAGSRAEPGTSVDVDYNQPPAPRRTTVPQLAGLTRDAAEQLLVRDSLQLGEVVLADEGPNAVVAAQQPQAGAAV